MSCKPLPTVALLCLLAGSCARRAPEPAVERLAILPVENLSADPALSAVGAAIGPILVSQTTGLRDLFTYLVNSASDVETLRPTRLLRSYLTKEGGRIRLHSFLHDAATGKAQRIVQPVGADPLSLARELAATVTSQPRPFTTQNPEAVKAFADALASGGGPQAESLLRRAVAADPAFGDAWIALTQILAATGHGETVRDILQQAMAQKIDPVSRARLQAVAARFDRNTDAQLAAVEKVAELEPANSDANLGAARQLILRRRIDRAIACYQRVTRADPNLSQAWNEFAYALAHAGKFAEGVAAAQRYVALHPGQANPSDSLGDVLFMGGRFKEAEASYLEGHKKDPRFLGGIELRKAAEARRMTRDLSGADDLFRRYTEAAAKLPLVEFQKAQWYYATGRAPQAAQTLEALAVSKSTPPEVASQAWSQLGIWRMAAGDRAGARAFAANAAEAAGKQADSLQARLAVMVRFVASDPATASEWTLRAERELGEPRFASIKRHALGIALLFGSHWQEASLVWKELLAQTPPEADGTARTLLAWALSESGKSAEARPLLVRYPHPRATGEGPFDGLAETKFRELRARLVP